MKASALATTCTRKKYRSEEQARLVCVRMANNAGVELYPLHCRKCGGWHAVRGQ